MGDTVKKRYERPSKWELDERRDDEIRRRREERRSDQVRERLSAGQRVYGRSSADPDWLSAPRLFQALPSSSSPHIQKPAYDTRGVAYFRSCSCLSWVKRQTQRCSPFDRPSRFASLTTPALALYHAPKRALTSCHWMLVTEHMIVDFKHVNAWLWWRLSRSQTQEPMEMNRFKGHVPVRVLPLFSFQRAVFGYTCMPVSKQPRNSRGTRRVIWHETSSWIQI